MKTIIQFKGEVDFHMDGDVYIKIGDTFRRVGRFIHDEESNFIGHIPNEGFLKVKKVLKKYKH